MTDEETKRRIVYHFDRLRDGMSYSEIARRAGTFPTTIKEIAEGTRMPGVGLLSRVAEALGSTLNEMTRPVPEEIPA